MTKIQVPNGFINPDHKIEYHHDEMMALLIEAGFLAVEIKGLNYMPQTRASGIFDYEEMANNSGVYDDYINCYLIYYRCILS